MANQQYPEIQKQLNENAEVQKALADMKAAWQRGDLSTGFRAAMTALDMAVKKAGIVLPHDMAIEPGTGQLSRQGFMQRNSMALLVGLPAAGIVGGAALGAGGAGGAVAPAAAANAGGVGTFGGAVGTSGMLYPSVGTGAGMSGLGAGAGVAGAGAPAGFSAAPLASTVLGASGTGISAGLAPGVTSSLAGTGLMGGETAAAGGSGVIKRLLGGAEGVSSGMEDIGSLLGKYADTEAANREDKWRATNAYDNQRLAAEQNQRLAETDAVKKLAQTSYLERGGNPYTPARVNSGQLPDYGFGPVATSAAQRAGASTLKDQLLKRLQPGGTFQPTPMEGYMNPGVGEKVGEYGSLIGSGIGAIYKILGNRG